jgi:hypothetical protein
VPGFMRGRDGGSTVSMFLTRCSANVSHAVAIANMVRFASGSLNVSASSRHLSAFSRYCPTRSGMRPVPAVRKTVSGNVAQISLFQGYSSSGDERGLQSSRSVCARAPAGGGVLWTAALFKLGHSGITRRPMTPVRVAGLIAYRRRESPLKMPLVQKQRISRRYAHRRLKLWQWHRTSHTWQPVGNSVSYHAGG